MEWSWPRLINGLLKSWSNVFFLKVKSRPGLVSNGWNGMLKSQMVLPREWNGMPLNGIIIINGKGHGIIIEMESKGQSRAANIMPANGEWRSLKSACANLRPPPPRRPNRTAQSWNKWMMEGRQRWLPKPLQPTQSSVGEYRLRDL